MDSPDAVIGPRTGTEEEDVLPPPPPLLLDDAVLKTISRFEEGAKACSIGTGCCGKQMADEGAPADLLLTETGKPVDPPRG